MGDPVLDAALDAVITVDGEGTIVELNSAAERIFGLVREEALGQPVAGLIIPGPQRPAHVAGLRRVVAGGPSMMMGRRVRLCAQRSDGREIVIEMCVTRTSETPPRFTAWIRPAPAEADDEEDDANAEQASAGSWEWTPSESKLLWSDSVFRILGLRPGEVVPDPRLVAELAHPDDRERVRRGQLTAMSGAELPPTAYRIVRADGEVRHVRTALTVAEWRDGEPYRLVGLVEDLTEQVRSRRGRAAHAAFARATAEWRSFDHDGQELLAGLAAALDCGAAIVWLPFKRELAARLVWRDSTAQAAILDPVRPGYRLRRDDGVVSRAWASCDLATASTAVTIPGIRGGEVLALLELRSDGPLDVSEPLMHCLRELGGELGRFLHEHRDELDMPALTPRELEVLQLAAMGCSSREIAGRLAIANATVRTHFENLYPKLGMSDRAAAVAAALRLGLID